MQELSTSPWGTAVHHPPACGCIHQPEAHWFSLFKSFCRSLISSPSPFPGRQWAGLRVSALQSLGLSGDEPTKAA